MRKQTNKRKVFNLYELGFDRGHDFGYYHHNEVESKLEIHHHTQTLEICFCLKGQQYYQVEDQIFKLKGNDILIVPPNVAHSTGSYPEDIGELYWLQISLNKQKGKLCYLPSEESDYLLEQLKNKGKFMFKGAFNLKQILGKLLEKLEDHSDTFNRLYINQLILQLLLETLMLAKEPQKMIHSERLDVLERYIAKNLHRTIYVDELADLIHISTVYFKSWFKQNFGIPPKAYINRLKIEQAKRDLPMKRTITQVAFDLGFSSSQYFSTIFKKHTGLSPRSYIASLNSCYP